MRPKSTAAKVLWSWGPLLAYAGLIFALSSMPQPPVLKIDVPDFDKVLHLIEYGGLGFLLCRALAGGGEGLDLRFSAAAAALVGALYGATDELHQSLVPGRDASLWDLLADALGAALGSVAYWRLARFRQGAEPRHPQEPPKAAG